LLNGIDLKPEKLRRTIRRIGGRDLKVENFSKTEKKVAEVCDIIGKTEKTITNWIGAIAVPEEVQTAEVEKPKEGQMSSVTLERISTIKDEETRKKVHSKIEKEDMGGPKRYNPIPHKSLPSLERFLRVVKGEDNIFILTFNVH